MVISPFFVRLVESLRPSTKDLPLSQKINNSLGY